jgi:hypothetical protein
MKKTSLKELKEDLSKWAEYAAGGEKVYVSKYNKPYIILIPSQSELTGVSGSGEAFHLKPAVQSGISSRLLAAVLMDDRGVPEE